MTSQEGAENPLPPCIYFLMISLIFSAAVMVVVLAYFAATARIA